MINLKRLQLDAFTAFACLALGSSALATPIDPINLRPVTVNTPSSAGTDLQTVINGFFTGVNVTTDQSPAGLWSLPSYATTTMIPTLEYTTGDTNDEFGIFFGTDTKTITTIPIFLPGAPASTTNAEVNISNGSITIGSLHGDCGTAVDCETVTNPLINPFGFGFFVSNATSNPLTGGSETFFTADQLNAGAPGALAFIDPTIDSWAFAFDDGTASPSDFNNYVVEAGTDPKVPGLQVPVPEPGTLPLFGAALAGLALSGFRRARRAARTA